MFVHQNVALDKKKFLEGSTKIYKIKLNLYHVQSREIFCKEGFRGDSDVDLNSSKMTLRDEDSILYQIYEKQ